MGTFEYLVDWWQNIRGGKLKPIAARGVGGSYPEPTCYVEGPENYQAGPFQADIEGNLMTRGPVLTDEKSWRYDFPGTSLSRSLTGTVSFTATSSEITGVGTSFTTELNTNMYVKLDAHPDTAWRRVIDVISDTEAELEDVYPTTGSGASSASPLVPTIGTGGSISIASSIASIASGTTSGSRTYVLAAMDYLPMMCQAFLSLSTRRANQEFVIGFADDFTAPERCVLAVFDGTNNTQVKFRTRSSSSASEIQETTVSLPNGLTTASQFEMEICVTADSCFLTIEGVRVASHDLHIPCPYATMDLVAGWYNSGVPAGTTTAAVDAIYVSNHDRLEIAQTFHGDQIPVRIEEEVHRQMGLITTTTTAANQIICQYTVPAGRTLFILSWNASNGVSTVDGSPVRLGKNIVVGTTDPAGPTGATDGQILRSVYLNTQTNVSETFQCPIYLAAAGETVMITVTPSATASTPWRGAFEFVLR